MLLSAIAGMTGALTLAAGAPVVTGAPPVSVVSCDYSHFDALSLPGTAPLPSRNLRITFVNNAPVAATDVRFAVAYGNHTQIIDDAGTFSTGAQITKDTAPQTYPSYRGSAECSVQSVTFSDGSVWQSM